MSKSLTIEETENTLVQGGGKYYPDYRLTFRIDNGVLRVSDNSPYGRAAFFMYPADVVDLRNFIDKHLSMEPVLA